MILFSGFIDK